MRPLVPVNDRTALPQFVEAGGDEFYLGFHDAAWHERFGRFTDLNRMTGFGLRANPYTFEEALDIVDEVRCLGKRVYITFNANGYSKAQIDYLFGYFEQLHDHGASGVIVSVPEVVQAAADSGLEVVASTMCGIYNADIARFYRERGCTRVIVPRDVSLAEIEAIIAAEPSLVYEAFLMRNGCIFSEASCLGRHFERRNALCWDIRHAERTFQVAGGSERFRQAMQRNNQVYGQLHESACGLCALWRLMRAGVTSAKIVGRSDDAACVVNDIRAIARNVEIAQECATEKEYLNRMYVPLERAGDCSDGLSCYYPEVRFP